MLDEETKDTIWVLSRSGFYDPETIVEIVCKEMFEPGEMGATIRDELQKAGFQVEWDGTFKQRLNLPTVVGQKRPKRA
jgi:hypothetical protein